MQRFFQAVSKQMEEQIRGVAEALQHPGMKGTGGEEALRAFLRTYLPNRYRIGQGKVVDHAGNESRQIDIIIMDARTTTPLYVDATNLVVPIESVYATVEVKSTLNRKTMADAIDNALTIQKLFLPSKYQFVRGGAVMEKSQRDVYPRSFVFALNRQKSSAIEAIGNQYLWICT